VRQNTKVNGESLEQRIWEFMYAIDEPLTGQEVAIGMKIGYWSAVQALLRMKKKGNIERIGGRYYGAYIASGPRPEDGRGKAAKSVTARLARWNRPPPPPTAVVSSPLAQALMWEPKYCASLVDKKRRQVRNTRGPVRPEKTEAA
jgi:hypothetical protein